jgi:hypothetical protein
LVVQPPHHHIKMSGCTFQFTRSSSIRTTLIDEATGHAKYKMETPIKASHVVTRIRKFENPANPPLNLDEDDDSDPNDDISDEEMEDKFSDGTSGDEIHPEMPEISDEMARIYWKLIAPDEIVFRGKVHIRSEFLPKCGKMKGWVPVELHVGNAIEFVSTARSYTFIGPDDVQYRWALGALGLHHPKVTSFPNSPAFQTLDHTMQLVTTDEQKRVIAEFHPAHHLINSRRARLEVQPEGMKMLDLIILTFVYVERKRRQREGAENRQPG